MKIIILFFLLFCSILVTAEDNKSNNSKFRRKLDPAKQAFVQQSPNGEEMICIRVSPRQFRYILSKRRGPSDVVIVLNQEQHSALCNICDKKDFSSKILIKVNPRQLERIASLKGMYISRPKNQFSQKDPSDLGITLDEQQSAEVQAISLGEQLPFAISEEQAIELRKQMYSNQTSELYKNEEEKGETLADSGKENSEPLSEDSVTEDLAKNSTDERKIAKSVLAKSVIDEAKYMSEEEEEKEQQREYIESEIALNEVYVADLLHTLATAENQFKEYAKIDLNKNGEGEYAFIQELGGIIDLRYVNDEASDVRVAPFIRPDFAKTAQGNKGLATEYGYYIYCYLPGREKAMGEEEGVGLAINPIAEQDEHMIEQQEKYFVIYAWPMEQNVTGRSAFVVDNTAKVFAWEKHNYSLENKPKPEDALDKNFENAANAEGNVSVTGNSNQGDWTAFDFDN